MLKLEQLAYLAAMFDGEGHFSVNRYKRKDKQKRIRGYGLKVVCRITQAKVSLLETLQSWFKDGETTIGRSGADRRCFHLYFNHPCLRDLIPQMMPHLILKRRQAEICMYFLVRQKHFTGRHPLSDDEWRHRIQLYEECRLLNTSPLRLKKQLQRAANANLSTSTNT